MLATKICAGIFVTGAPCIRASMLVTSDGSFGGGRAQALTPCTCMSASPCWCGHGSRVGFVCLNVRYRMKWDGVTDGGGRERGARGGPGRTT
jgi:hypothetical protein